MNFAGQKFLTAPAALLLLVGSHALAADTTAAKRTVDAETKPETKEFVPGELIIGFKSDAKIAAGKAALQKPDLKGGDQFGTVKELGGRAVKVEIRLAKAAPKASAADHLKAISAAGEDLKRSNPEIAYVHPNWIQRAPAALSSKGKHNAVFKAGGDAAPNDPAFSQVMWHLKDGPGGINAPAAWPVTTGDPAVTVAVIADGLDENQPDIVGNPNLRRGIAFVSSEGGPTTNTSLPTATIGTLIGGLIGAAKTNNKIGIASIAPNAGIMPVRIFGAQGTATSEDIANSIRWAAGLPVPVVAPAATPAQIIVLGVIDLDMPCQNDVRADAVRDAVANGAVVITSVGSNEVSKAFPANCPGVVSVMGTDFNGKRAEWLQSSGAVTIMAPIGALPTSPTSGNYWAELVWSTPPTDCTRLSDPLMVGACREHGVVGVAGYGIDMAHVAGAVALAMSVDPSLRGKPDLVAQRLRQTARPLAADACQVPCGPGLVDASALVSARSLKPSASPNAPGAKVAAQPVVGTIERSKQELAQAAGAAGSTDHAKPAAATQGGVSEAASAPAAAPASPIPQSNSTNAAPDQKPVAPKATLDTPETPNLSGSWLSESGEGTIVIAGSAWTHAEKGIADIVPGEVGGTLDVRYQNHDVTCSYRVHLVANGGKLVLEATNPTQPHDFCPAGTLLKLDH